ncbi:Glucuronoxylanase XynC [Pontiella desulfatans]|uniref:Glucuronoxylanase XynC n=1 Tax=Pontiella desulfatans TaxID=2750659 RepID=A0A6C2U4P2_PONDE|nr:LamG-like jellyroll fold domain-containing protein [Pontiella desulfatans]VGO14511.1 Glucuronoxylanase XynC [Pontiella desulfatans]
MKWMNAMGLCLLLAARLAGAATTAGTVEINPELRGVLITDWGYDIKNASVINGLTASKAQELFIDDRMSVLRVAVWGDATRPAHPAAGEIDVSYYVYDPAVVNSKKMFTAMKNARDARPDVVFFPSKKLDGQNSFPAWTKDGNGVVPEQYARLLADYLRFWEHDLVRKSESFVFPMLGVDNEEVYNEGNITPEKHLAIVNALRAMSEQAGTVDLIDTTHPTHPVVTVPAAFTMPPVIIGPEDYGPSYTFVEELLALPGGGASLDLLGTHYYPRWRPYPKLADMIGDGEGRPCWNSEVHWDNQGDLDDLEDAESALAAIFDNIELGLSGYVWWAYTRTGFKGEMEKAITTSSTLSRPCAIDDEDGFNEKEPLGTLITRAFREGGSLRVWALNVSGTEYADHAFNLLQGGICGDVSYKRWANVDGSFVSSGGSATVVGSNTFSGTLPTNSITLFTLPYASPTNIAAIYSFEGDASDSSGSGNHGTLAGGGAFVDGRDAQCLEFNGVDASVSIPRNISTEFTIAFWMRADVAGSEGAGRWWEGSGLVDGEVAGAAGDFGIALHGSNVAFGVGQPDTTILSQTDMADGQWRHVAATRNSATGEMELFINGASEAVAHGPGGTKAAPPLLRIGCLQTGANHFAGQLDEVRIYDRVLEQSEIQQLAFFDATALLSETWDAAAPAPLVGIGSVQADNLWTYNARNRTDWGISAEGALEVETAGTHSSSLDAETPLPRTVDPMKFEWVTLQAAFAFNALTTDGNTDTRVYAVDGTRQNGYGIMARSETDSQSPVLLRVLSGGATATVFVGAVGSQEADAVYDVTASFKRVSGNFTQVRYRVLKDGAKWRSGDVVLGKAPVAGSLLEKMECSQQKNAFSTIDDVALSIQPDLRDLYIDTFNFQTGETNLVMMVDVPEIGTTYHIETATSGMLFAAEPGTTFIPDVSPWRIELPLETEIHPARFFRLSEGVAP